MFGIKFRKKKSPPLGYLVLIDFCPGAKEKAIGGDILKRIYHINNGYVYDYESYSWAKHLALMRDKVTIINRTLGQEIPKDSYYVPNTAALLGQIQIMRML